MVAIISSGYSGVLRSSVAQLGAGGLLGSSTLGRGGLNVYVNAATGNLTLDRNDEVLIGRGLDATFGWQYNTRNLNTNLGTDGPRWNSKRRETIGHRREDGTWRHRDSDFQTSLFTYDASRGTWLNSEGGGAADEMILEGHGVWRDGDTLMRETYDGNLRPIYQTDIDGNNLTYSRIGADPTKLTTADGGSLDFIFDASGRVSHIVTNYTDANGAWRTKTRTRYAWDEYGRLLSTTTDLTPDDHSIADGKVYTTSYSYHGTTQYVAAVTQTDGSRLDIGYDANGRVISYSETTAAGVVRQTALTYEIDGNGLAFTRVRDALQQDTFLYYDAKGHLTKVVAPAPVPGAPAPSVSYGYNGKGDLVSVTDAYGNVTSYTHDARGNVTSITDAFGNVVNRRYNSLNRLLAEWRTASDAGASAAVQTTRYAYDSEQHLRYVVSPAGRVTEYRYTAAGEIEYTIEYPEHLYPSPNLGTEHDLTEAQLDAWRNGLADKRSTKITAHTYDLRGNLASSTVFGTNAQDGSTSTADGYSRTVFVHDEAGNLVFRRKDGQNAETFTYDGMGRLTGSTDLNAGTTSIVYNDASTQTVVTFATGYVKTSTYDRTGELLSVTESGAHVAGGESRFKYDKLGRVRVATDPTNINTYYLYDKTGRRVAEIAHNGALTEYRYDGNNRLIATMRYTNAVANPAQLADPNSTVELAAIRPAYHQSDVCAWTFYDKEGRVSATADGSGAVQSYEYDQAGRLVKTIAHYNKLSVSQTNGFKNDTPLTLALPAADSRDAVARNFYDKAGLLLAALDGEGFLTRNLYDHAGQKVEEIAYFNATDPAHRASGTLNTLIATTATHAGDRHTRFAYDGRGFLRYQVDALNQVTEYGYDSAGQVISTVRYAGSIAATSDYTHDNIKALVTASGLADSAATRRNWTVYDASGRLAFAIDGEDAVTRLVYDSSGRVTKSIQYAARHGGSLSAPGYDTMHQWALANDGNGANRVTRNYYSARGELRFTIDAEGYVSRTDFDSAGRKTYEVRWDSALSSVTDGWTIDTVNSSASGTSTFTRYGYENGGALSDMWDGEGNQTRYTYYGNGKLASKWVVEADPSVTQYHYDAAGRVTAEYAANGAAEQANTFYAYDGHGNLISVTDPRGNVTTRTYDKLGQVLTETNAAGTVSFQYDAFGQAVKATDARGNFTQTAYDRLGRVVTSTDALGVSTHSAYDAFGGVLSVTRGNAVTSFLYDRLGRLVRTTDAENHYEHYTLDAFGNRISVRNKAGGIVANAYDRRGLLVTETLPMASHDSNGTLIASTVTNRFQYDARGNRIRIIEAEGLSEQRTTTFVYDKADRLVEKRGDSVPVLSASDYSTLTPTVPTETYKYDQRGRLIESKDALGARTLFFYDKLNRKTAELSAVGTLTTFTYDKSGNVLASRVYATAVALPAAAGGAAPAAPGGEYRETTYTYDVLSRLKTSTIANVRTGFWNGSSYQTSVGQITSSVDYDQNGNIVKTTDGAGGTIFSFYDKANRKVAQVDQENYLTFWTLDGEGNVTREERFAARLGFAVTTSHDPSSLRSAVAGQGPDRVTEFAYDRNGRRISETRLGVYLGVAGAGTVGSTLAYSYTALGQVSQKTFANGDAVSFAYDLTGRLTEESRAGFTDASGNWVRPTTYYHYNGINNLTLSRQGAQARSDGDRFTRYAYGAGGRMTGMTDAAGNSYSFHHDAAGNVLRESWSRTRSDGSTASEALLYTRDLLGRATSQSLAIWVGSWAKGQSRDTAYNAYGEVSRRGIDGMWQEKFGYDGAGRLSRTNSGDGVWRFFVNDANGKRTLAIESEGTDLTDASVDTALSIATGGFAHSVGGAYIDGVNATIEVLDRRGQAIQTRLPKRQLSGSPGTSDLSVSRTYTAFGEVASETDPRGGTTDFAYNAMGRLIEKHSPFVNATGENGVTSYTRPVERYSYDAAGRMIGVRDANGFDSSRVLLAGTGHDGSEALVTAEHRADGGAVRTWYDVFGDARRIRDELDRDETRLYDNMGRLVQQNHKGGLLIDFYAYDLLGQRTRHWNNIFSPYEVERTDYDTHGRVVSQIGFGGDTTTTSYSWNAAIATAGMGTFGGWTETTTVANGRSSSEQSDIFGRQVYKSDLGGNVTTYTFDTAGRAYKQFSPGETLTYSWLNTGLLGSVDDGGANYAIYGYDAGGNRISEYTVRGYSVVQNATASYDALGRLSIWSEAGTVKAPPASTSFKYDLVGNIRSSLHTYHRIEVDGSTGAAAAPAEHWFLYDSANRLVRDKGSLENGTIVRGSGTDYTYFKDGQRKTATISAVLSGPAWQYQDPSGQPTIYPDGEGEQQGQWVLIARPFDGVRREDYTYDSAGRMTEVRIAESWIDPGPEPSTWWEQPQEPVIHHPTSPGGIKASFYYDGMNRLTRQTDWAYYGSAAYDRWDILYNAKGQILSERINSKQGSDTLTSFVQNDYGYGSGYALGTAVGVSTTDSRTSGSTTTHTTSQTNNYFTWRDGAVQSSMSYWKTNQSTYWTYYSYNPSGALASVQINDGRPRTVTFTNDMNGQAIRRDEADNLSGGDPHEVWYRFNGRQMAFIGNNGTLDTDYSTSIANRTKAAPSPQGPFRFGATGPTFHAELANSLSPINSYDQGSSAGAYTVRQGESLSSIAAQLWGDSSLWYKLAEANGLSAAAALTDGQRLTIPVGVMKNTHNASTFKPYDPSETLGETTPTNPKAPKKNKCGVFGQILLVAVSVAISFALPALAPGVFGGVIGGIGAAVVGSAVSQGVGLATGIQDKFSWKQVALAGLSAGVSGGLGSVLGKAGVAGSKLLTDIVRGAASSAITQGIAVSVGLQKKFDWAGVAAAGIGAGVGGAISRKLVGPLADGVPVRPETTWSRAGNFGHDAVVGIADAFSQATARSVVDGSSFGDNLIAALPSAIGNTIGNALAKAVREPVFDRRIRKLAQSDLLPEDLRGTPAAAELIRQSVEAGRTNKEIRRMLADPGAQNYIYGRQIEIDSWTAPVPLLDSGEPLGPQLHLASTDPFADPWEEEQNRRFTLEGVFDSMGNAARARYNRRVQAQARSDLEWAIARPDTSPLAREVLQSFLTGRGPREFYYGPGSAGISELFDRAPGSYYRREEVEAMRYMAFSKYNTGDLRNGYQVTQFLNRNFNPLDGALGYRDGIHLGDITGTFSGGITAVVRGDRVHFRAENRMNLVSYAGGNLLGFQNRYIDLPSSGRPLSQVRMVFEWSRPIPPYLRPRQ